VDSVVTVVVVVGYEREVCFRARRNECREKPARHERAKVDGLARKSFRPKVAQKRTDPVVQTNDLSKNQKKTAMRFDDTAQRFDDYRSTTTTKQDFK